MNEQLRKQANEETLERLNAAQPVLVDVAAAVAS